MQGGAISGNSTSNFGGGVFVNSGGTFTMSDGTISGNSTLSSSTSSNWGGGVYVNSGTFTMTGGTISGNSASWRGGGVALSNNNSTFTMSGGNISGNSAKSDDGGGVYVGGNGRFTMTGGTISGNSAGDWGGGVRVDAGTFTMSGGTISGNSAKNFGGGVYVVSNGTFTKSGGGTIDATNSATNGKVAYVNSSPVRVRNSAAGSSANMDSRTSGSAGGWENATSVISGITYSSVSGGSWTLQSDGRRKSPSISSNGVTKTRVSFTSASSSASITIQLEVSSEESCDYAFISQVDNSSATYQSGYYNGSLISGTRSVTVTIPVSSSGSHYIDIGYRKDGSSSSGSDCAWFKVIE
jgi:hypothetical protein